MAFGGRFLPFLKLGVVLASVFLLALGAVFTTLSLFIDQASAQATAQFYVAPWGNDSNPGTSSQPFKTPQRATEAVRPLLATQASDIRVVFFGGTYELKTPWTLLPADSGRNGFKVIYENADAQEVVISGGSKITNWQAEGSVLKAQVPAGTKTRQLYVNGKRAVRARSEGGLPGVTQTSEGYTTTHPTIASWGNQNQIEFVSNVEWKQFRCLVGSISGSTITMQQPCYHNASKVHLPNNMKAPTWIENARELLDQPGEWYLNTSTNWLYYYPRAGETAPTLDVVLPQTEQLLVLQGNPDYVQNLVFKGFTFAYATWMGPSSNTGLAEVQANFHMKDRFFNDLGDGPWFKPGGNIVVKRGHLINFSQNNFVHLGGVGLLVEDGSKGITIDQNHFYDISSGGIYFGDIDKPSTTIDAEITRDNAITNNLINDTGVEYQGSVGLWVGYVKNMVISHNELFNLPYTAISIGWGWGTPSLANNNYVIYNKIHDYMKVLRDGGGIYSLGPQPNNVYRQNYLYNQPNEYGAMYLDDGSKNISVLSNIIFNNKRSAIYKGGEHLIQGNYWQNRYSGDIWAYQNGNCSGSCGASNVSNNVEITSLSQVPTTLLAPIGLEGGIPLKLQRPAALSISPLRDTGGSAVISWTPVSGATNYALRINDTSDAWVAQCPSTTGPDVCIDVTSNSYTYNFVPGRRYDIWVHAFINGQHTEAVAFSYTLPAAPSPLPSPSPSPTPLPSPTCLGDANTDRKVDLLDYSLLVVAFFKRTTGTVFDSTDFNKDHVTDLIDYSLLVKNFLKPC